MNSFEQVALALGVVAEEEETSRVQFQRDFLKVTKVGELQVI